MTALVTIFKNPSLATLLFPVGSNAFSSQYTCVNIDQGMSNVLIILEMECPIHLASTVILIIHVTLPWAILPVLIVTHHISEHNWCSSVHFHDIKVQHHLLLHSHSYPITFGMQLKYKSWIFIHRFINLIYAWTFCIYNIGIFMINIDLVEVKKKLIQF